MSIEQLTAIEEEFAKYLQIIRYESKQLPKCQVLKIVAWLKKLCSVVDNIFWRKNRNLHAQVMSLMLMDGNLQCPFDKYPPQTSLPKLNIYEIPFSIRQKLQGKKHKNQDKQNNQMASNLQKNNQGDINYLRLKKKQSLNLKCLNSMNMQKQNTQQQQQSLINQILTQRKATKKEQKNQKILNTVEQILYFLAKNNEKFSNDSQFTSLIKQIISFGDENNCNFRQMKFSPNNC